LNPLKVYTDGASRSNPGHSAIGIVIYDNNNNILAEYKEYVGTLTNNQAEYRGLIKSAELLKKMKDKTFFDSVEFFSDSELMVNQVNFSFRIKDADLALLNNKFQYLIRQLGVEYKISCISREENTDADRLANEALDKELSGKLQTSLDF
jgi:ribonuclease HI